MPPVNKEAQAHAENPHPGTGFGARFVGSGRASKSAAFTLLELLVVIAVIVILVSLLLPSLTRAKDQARTASCKNNLRQMGIALTVYVSEFRHYPMYIPGYAYVETFGKPEQYIWADLLLPLVASNRLIFNCPSNPEKYRWTNSPMGFFVNVITNGFSYGYNEGGGGIVKGNPYSLGLGWGGNQLVSMTPLAESRVMRPANMIAIGDSTSDFYWDISMSPQHSFPRLWPGKRHSQGANVAFCDGHVEFFKQDVLVDENDDMRRRWNNDHEPHPETWRFPW
jgi:prepilin-type processing-associated H-X9-DG protein/prepilin-type N-terminal cleavage/methylation domain-containing protein